MHVLRCGGLYGWSTPLIVNRGRANTSFVAEFALARVVIRGRGVDVDGAPEAGVKTETAQTGQQKQAMQKQATSPVSGFSFLLSHRTSRQNPSAGACD